MIVRVLLLLVVSACAAPPALCEPPVYGIRLCRSGPAVMRCDDRRCLELWRGQAPGTMPAGCRLATQPDGVFRFDPQTCGEDTP